MSVQIQGLPDPKDPKPTVADIIIATTPEELAEKILVIFNEASVPNPPSPSLSGEVKS